MTHHFIKIKLFIDLYITDQFSKDILYQLGEHDIQSYKPSDVTIYISTTSSLVKEFLNKRHGERIWEQDSWFDFISKMPPRVDSHINKIKENLKNLIKLDRGEYDFSMEADKQKLFTMLSNIDFEAKKT